jgi:hypothetical protein
MYNFEVNVLPDPVMADCFVTLDSVKCKQEMSLELALGKEAEIRAQYLVVNEQYDKKKTSSQIIITCFLFETGQSMKKHYTVICLNGL